MARITIKGYITASHYEWMKPDEAPRFSFQTWKPSKDGETAIVCEHEFEVDLPADFDPLAMQIRALEEKKDALAAKFAKEVRSIQERLAKLQAIEYTPVAEAA